VRRWQPLQWRWVRSRRGKNTVGALATASKSQGSNATRTRLTLTALRSAATAETMASTTVTTEILPTVMDATLSANWRMVGSAREALPSNQTSVRKYAEMESISTLTPMSVTIQTLRAAMGKTKPDTYFLDALQLARLSMPGPAPEAAQPHQTLVLRPAATESHSRRSPRQPTVMTETATMETAAAQHAR